MSISKQTKGQIWYRDEYLGSGWWEHVKIEVKKRDGGVCSMWGCQRRDVAFHHVSYIHRGEDREIDDVRVVCRLHHTLCHYTWFGLIKLPLTKKALTRRYKRLRWQSWRRVKPSSILGFIIRIYATD